MGLAGVGTTLALVVIALATMAPGAGAQAPAGTVPLAAPPRREVRLGLAGLDPVADPVLALDGAGPLIARQVFDTLVAYREDSTDVEPALATRWTVSRDGLTWTFVLRDGVRFHDGTPLTAADVVASFDRHLRSGEPQRPPPIWTALLRGTPGVVREVRTTDPRTVQFVLSQPYAPLLTVLAHPGFGVVRVVAGPDGAGRLVGTGPYRVAEAGPGRLVLEAAAGHWGGRPRSERLVLLEVIGDEQAEPQLDAAALDVWFPADPPRRDEGVLSAPSLQVGYLAFQTEKEPFSRKANRQAVAAAIDPAILGVVLGRAAVPLQSFLPTGTWARREGSPVLGGTRQQAVALLRAGGWPEGFSPTLLAATGGGSLDLAPVAEAVRRMLEAVEVPVRIRLEPEPAAGAARAAGEHDVALLEGRVLAGDPHLFLYPLSTSEGASRGPQTRNFSFYRNPRLDDVLIRASQLAFRPERERLYRRAQALLGEELPWIPLYVRLQWAVTRPPVRGLRLHPTGFHRLGAVAVQPPPALPLP